MNWGEIGYRILHLCKQISWYGEVLKHLHFVKKWNLLLSSYCALQSNFHTVTLHLWKKREQWNGLDCYLIWSEIPLASIIFRCSWGPQFIIVVVIDNNILCLSWNIFQVWNHMTLIWRSKKSQWKEMCSQMLFFRPSLRPGRRPPSGKRRHQLNPQSLQKPWLLHNVDNTNIYYVKLCSTGL